MLTLVVSMRTAKVVSTVNSVLLRKGNAAVYFMAKQAWPWHPAQSAFLRTVVLSLHCIGTTR